MYTPGGTVSFHIKFENDQLFGSRRKTKICERDPSRFFDKFFWRKSWRIFSSKNKNKDKNLNIQNDFEGRRRENSTDCLS